MLEPDGPGKHRIQAEQQRVARTPYPGTLFRQSMRQHVIGLLCALILTIGGSGRVAAQEGMEASETVDAIWHVQAVDLQFRSPTTYYRCDGLREKIASILRAVGASGPMHISARCFAGALINQTSVRIVVGMPVEATPENVRIATTFDTHSELVAQLRSWELPTPTTLRHFRAAWTTVSFARLGRLHLGPQDCDLLHDISEQVFPRLAIRVTDKMPTCSPSSSPSARPRLVVKALLPVST